MTNNHQRHHLPETTDKEYGEIVHYEYDGCDQLSAIVYSDSTKISYAYDKNDNMTTVTDRKGLVTTLSYDGTGNLSAVQDDENRRYTYSYNSRNLVTGETDPLGSKKIAPRNVKFKGVYGKS